MGGNPRDRTRLTGRLAIYRMPAAAAPGPMRGLWPMKSQPVVARSAGNPDRLGAGAATRGFPGASELTAGQTIAPQNE